MTNRILYAVVFILLMASYRKDARKTKTALKKAWKSFENILPQFLGVIILVGILLSVLNPQIIGAIIGGQSGLMGTVISAVIGAITLIPGFVAFPTAALLFENGAGLVQIAAFISSLMMVGVVTIPIESQFFGRKLTFWRNISAFIFSFVVAYIMGRVLGT
ncbi:hypothetical protein SAMN05446037_1007119 [Anaerovirgula multivorans]|uniref:Permease n=1 Tax=Anaerovirgula multivorans TaxID=312168 RepID=A0A239DEI4_9FIRM|nr:permease [Anaerovirgula multivorans]SNS30311.1 hypothetical protein SAMN05446037_1007119 [Anaerovirgula multivorans]